MEGVVFCNLLFLLTIKGFLLQVIARLCFVCVYSIMQYGSETYPVKGDNTIRLGRNDGMMVWQICSARPEEQVSRGTYK